MASLSDSLVLRSGTEIKNRICKASMAEGLGTADGLATQAHIDLYKAWVDSGASILITGNMMVDGRHMNEALVVDALHDQNFTTLARWAQTAKDSGVHIWPQLSHPGKQSPKMINDAPIAPSAIPMQTANPDMFVDPREMTEEEILDVIDRFGASAERCEKAGFTGVQLHGAHGYLIGQFLSPKHNQRTDHWGGSFENRLRFVVEIYKAVRERTSDKFNVCAKINSADFQKGGFTAEDSIKVAKALDDLGIDLIELSGGSWENPVNRTGAVKESTRKREAYFLEFAEEVKKNIKAPLMVTGGFRSAQGMNEAIASGAVDMVGAARPFAQDPNFGNKALANSSYASTVAPIKSGLKKIDAMAIMEISWYTLQIDRISRGLKTQNDPNGVWPALRVMYRFWKNGKAVKRVRA